MSHRKISLLLFVTILGLLIGLAGWQWHRFREKRALEELAGARAGESRLLLSASTQDRPDLYERKVKLIGCYDQNHQILIDNQVYRGMAGYYVLTPFRMQASTVLILVNRGWIALGADRNKLPPLPVQRECTEIKGTVEHFPSVGMRLQGDDIPTAGWPSVVQVVNVAILSQRLGLSISPYQVLLDAAMDDGFVREWKKKPVLSAQRHLAYAFQWLMLALAWFVLCRRYLWLRK